MRWKVGTTHIVVWVTFPTRCFVCMCGFYCDLSLSLSGPGIFSVLLRLCKFSSKRYQNLAAHVSHAIIFCVELTRSISDESIPYSIMRNVCVVWCGAIARRAKAECVACEVRLFHTAHIRGNVNNSCALGLTMIFAHTSLTVQNVMVPPPPPSIR